MITHGDPPTGDGHDADAANPSNNDESADGGRSLPEPDPESALSAPSMLDPSEGIDGQGGLNRAAQDNSPLTDTDGNPVGNAQDYQNEQVDAPSVVLIPPPSPYYGPRQPLYGYPNYGTPLGRYPSVGRAYSRMLSQPIPPNVGFGAMPPPGYPWIGGSPMVPWSATHPILPPSHLLLRSFPSR
jgi:hypothetical protein